MSTITKTLPIAKAREIAQQVGLGADVEKALVEAEALGYSVVDYEIDYGVNGHTIGVTRHTGVMVSLQVPVQIGEAYAIPGGEPVFDFHVTVVYLGDLADISVVQQQTLIGIVSDVAREFQPLRGLLTGLGVMERDDEETDALYIGVEVPGIHELRNAVTRRLEAAEIEYRDDFEFFQPHMTIAYAARPEDGWEDAFEDLAVQPARVRFACLTAAIGGAHYDAPFVSEGMYYGAHDYDDSWVEGARSAYRPNFQKSLTVRKDEMFTLGAWYVPDFLDAHDEWISTEDVEKAFHDYVRSGDRYIRLQHNTDIIAGEWVEAHIERAALEVEVPDPDTGALVKHSYPAGTPFLGVKWNPWAWELVKAGEIRGYSIGGTAQSFEVDLGPNAATAAQAA